MIIHCNSISGGSSNGNPFILNWNNRFTYLLKFYDMRTGLCEYKYKEHIYIIRCKYDSNSLCLSHENNQIVLHWEDFFINHNIKINEQTIKICKQEAECEALYERLIQMSLKDTK